MGNEESFLSKSALTRLPQYLRFLKAMAAKGTEYISSAEIAAETEMSAVAVRKDLALVASVAGTPHKGFPVKTLISDIERFLGYHETNNAVVVGAGGLGRALLAYEGFFHYGIHVVAGFDSSPAQIGAVKGKPIYPMDRLSEIVKRERVRIGIVTVPRDAAQEVCDKLVDAGITAIMSFAPTYVSVPEGVRIKYEDLAASLAALCGGVLLSE